MQPDYTKPLLGRHANAAGTRVIFVRHGNVHNPRNVIYGRLPRMRLSEAGHREMQQTGASLADLPVAAIYTSPLLRARQSAQHIAARHPRSALRRCADLIEVGTSWQGESNKAVREIPGFSYYDPLKGEGDETILDVFTRMNRALDTVLRRHPGQTSVCVSHGDPIKILWIAYSGRSLTADEVRSPDPGQASAVILDFWHAGALPIVSTLDPNRMDRFRAAHRSAQEPTPDLPSGG